MPESSVGQYLSVLRRQFWLIWLTFALAAGTALVVSATEEPTYRASMKIVVGQESGLFQPQFGGAVQPFTQTMSSLLKSDVVARTVIEERGLQMTPEELLGAVRISTQPESSVLDVNFDSPNARQAVVVLDEIGTVFTRLVDRNLGLDVTGSAEESLPDTTARVFDPAHLEPGQVSPRPVRNVLVAGLLGLALGVVLAFLRESLDDRLRNRRDAEEWFGARVIGALPRGMIGRPPFGLASQPNPKDAKRLRGADLLRASFQFSYLGSRGGTVLITSTVPEEGKSTVAANLGVALAMAGEDVICVEADAQRPALARYLCVQEDGSVQDDEDLDLEQALLEVALKDSSTMVQTVKSVPIPSETQGEAHLPALSVKSESRTRLGRLRVLPSSQLPPELFRTDPLGDLVEFVADLRSRARYVIFDSPPVLSMGDAFPLLLASDNIIVVGREGRTKKDLAELARDTLDRLGVRDLSVVLVESSLPREGSYH